MKTHQQIVREAVNVDAAVEAATEYFLSTAEIIMISRYAWSRRVAEDDVDLKDEDTRDDYEDFVTEYATERVHEALADLCWSIDTEEGRVSAWRSLTVAPDFIENGILDRPIGPYWSYTEEAAESHWGNFGDGRRELVLHGVVGVDDIDWQKSVTMNAHSEEEKELRLKGSAVIRVISATWTKIHGGEPAKTIALDMELVAGDRSTPYLEPEMATAA